MMRQVITLSLLLIGLFAQSSVAQVMGNGFTPFFEGSGGARFAVSLQKNTINRPQAMYQAGALVGVEMRQRHGATFVKSGLLFENYRFLRGVSESQPIKVSYFDMPIVFGYRWPFNKSLSISASVGLSFIICYHYNNLFSGFEVSRKSMDRNSLLGGCSDLSFEYVFSDCFSITATALICYYFQQTMWITYEHQRSIETPSFFNLRFGIKYYYKH